MFSLASQSALNFCFCFCCCCGCYFGFLHFCVSRRRYRTISSHHNCQYAYALSTQKLLTELDMFPQFVFPPPIGKWTWFPIQNQSIFFWEQGSIIDEEIWIFYYSDEHCMSNRDMSHNKQDFAKIIQDSEVIRWKKRIRND